MSSRRREAEVPLDHAELLDHLQQQPARQPGEYKRASEADGMVAKVHRTRTSISRQDEATAATGKPKSRTSWTVQCSWPAERQRCQARRSSGSTPRFWGASQPAISRTTAAQPRTESRARPSRSCHRQACSRLPHARTNKRTYARHTRVREQTEGVSDWLP